MDIFLKIYSLLPKFQLVKRLKDLNKKKKKLIQYGK